MYSWPSVGSNQPFSELKVLKRTRELRGGPRRCESVHRGVTEKRLASAMAQIGVRPLAVFDPLLGVLRKLAALPNVTVRPSALNFGDNAPTVAGLHAGSTAAMPDIFRAKQCPAPTQNNNCGDCRACWEAKDTPVAYARH